MAILTRRFVFIGMFLAFLPALSGCFESNNNDALPVNTPPATFEVSCNAANKSAVIDTQWKSGIWEQQTQKIDLYCSKSDSLINLAISALRTAHLSFCEQRSSDVARPAPDNFHARPELRETPNKQKLRGIWIDFNNQKGFYPCADAASLLEQFKVAAKRCCSGKLESK